MSRDFEVTDHTLCVNCGIPAGEHRPDDRGLLACATPSDLFEPEGIRP